MARAQIGEDYSSLKDKFFLLCIVIAVLLHAGLLLFQFTMPQQQGSVQDIAVTIRPSEKSVEHADFLAQADQQGSGQYKDKHKTSTEIAPAPETQTAGEQAQLHELEMIQQQRELHFEEKVLMTVLSWQKQSEEQERKKAKEQFESQYQAKAAMIASLEAQYLRRQQDYSRQQSIKTVDGIQAKRDASAAYLEKFREKVELYGNRYYPEQAKQLAGEVQLMVILNAEGGIRAIRLLESSGHAILDEAAKNSVRRGAPFGRFDKNMQNISELRIVRTWRFDPAQAEFEVK